MDVGDYECGTSYKTAWAIALQGAPWEGCLDSYTNSKRIGWYKAMYRVH